MEKHPHKKAKRRPGREQVESQTAAPSEATADSLQAAQNEAMETDVKVVDVETGHTSGGESVAPAPAENSHEAFHTESHSDPKIEIKFAGSELIRAKFPKPFEVVETIATDWVHDGRFEGLPLGHPLAQYFAAKGLRKAKELEKKVLESPMTEKIAMQALTAGMKAQEIISQVRSKVKKP